MSAPGPGPTVIDTPAGGTHLPYLGEVLAGVVDGFVAQGALGVVAVDASPLREIEVRYGHEAQLRSMQTLATLVREVSQEAFSGTGAVACGELGRSEVLLLLPRSYDDGPFYTKDLPALTRLLGQRLERHAQRIAYPYLRRPPQLSVGVSFTLRNPRLGAATQIRHALEEARADAELNGRVAYRDRRRQILDVIVSGRVRSVYEPIVDAKTLTVFGYEALARGPDGTDLASPSSLFEAADEGDLSFALDCLCRMKAIEGAVDFPPGAKLFVNIRPSAIHDPQFQPDELTRTLARCELAPTDVVFEISEQESFENYAILREARDEYGKLGFQFALDDTGAGYACLEAAMELEPEFLKVDRAFISGIDEDRSRQNMLRAFQAMAERMNARIIGEGLDRLEELRMLVELGIPFGQGWLFGKPTPLRPTEQDRGR